MTRSDLPLERTFWKQTEAKALIKETMTGVFSELWTEKWKKKNCSRTGEKNKRESKRKVN